MPVRAKFKPQAPAAPRTPSPAAYHPRFPGNMPDIEHGDNFRDVVKKLSIYITENIVLPSTFEQLRTTAAGDSLRELVQHLGETCTNPAIVNALLALKWHYGSVNHDKGLMEARANSCEIVAWRFLVHLSEREAVDFCLYEIPPPVPAQPTDDENAESSEVDENSPLLIQAWNSAAETAQKAAESTGTAKRYQLLQSISQLTASVNSDSDDEDTEDPTAPFINLNALEIAAIADAKRFLGQNVVQKIITGIWNGDIIFWDSLSVHSTKKPRFYNPRTMDPFSRLRVPKYLKCFEVLFFIVFLVLYFWVLVARNTDHITFDEVLLYVWLCAFFYDELSEWIDAGSIFYAADVWNLFDIIMISIGLTFAILRIVGLSNGDTHLIELSYDILALEALFMVPRVCSILSLSPYWGTLIPCLKEMGKDFIKFMVLVVIVYLGFLTTFTLIGKDSKDSQVSDATRMAMTLTKIFFGNSGTGFDIMRDIDPVFGPPLMIIFVMLSSILLMGSLTGMLSNSFSRVITHAREEYLYVYSVYVLEASTSNRLTHFYPPFNLLALIIFRPLRLFLPSHNRFRQARIVLLKATHLPIVALIQLYELLTGRLRKGSEVGGFKGPRSLAAAPPTPERRQRTKRPSAQARPSSTYRPDGRPNTASGASPRRPSVGEDDDMSNDDNTVDLRIRELSSKIDQLTEIVLRYQSQQQTPLGDMSM